MQPTAEELREHYRGLESEELAALHRAGTLTERATTILLAELARRGFDPGEIPPPEDTPATRSLEGLGGWLVLPLISLAIAVVARGYGLVTEILPIFTQGHWEYLTTPGSEQYDPLWGVMIVYETAGMIALLVASVFLLAIAFQRSRFFPFLMVGYLAFYPVFVVGEIYLAESILALGVNDEMVKALVQSVLYAVVWVPYFLVSRRVKQTFVR